MIKNKKTLAISSLMLSALFFGSTFVVVKDLLNDFSPLNIVFMRYGLAAILFLFTGGIPKKATLPHKMDRLLSTVDRVLLVILWLRLGFRVFLFVI